MNLPDPHSLFKSFYHGASDIAMIMSIECNTHLIMDHKLENVRKYLEAGKNFNFAGCEANYWNSTFSEMR